MVSDVERADGLNRKARVIPVGIRKASVLFMVMKFETVIGFMDLEYLKFLSFFLC